MAGRRTGAALGAAVLVVGAYGAVALGDGPAGTRVPQELVDPPGAPAVLPVTAPEGYRYDGSSASAVQGALLSRTVLLRPASLAHQPTVSLCVDVSAEHSSCPATGGAVDRQVDGVSVRITLRGPGSRAARERWRSLELTSDPQRSSLFAA